MAADEKTPVPEGPRLWVRIWFLLAGIFYLLAALMAFSHNGHSALTFGGLGMAALIVGLLNNRWHASKARYREDFLAQLNKEERTRFAAPEDVPFWTLERGKYVLALLAIGVVFGLGKLVQTWLWGY